MKRRSVRWLLASASLAVVFTCDVQATVYDLYYLGGQSNMDGYGRVEDLPTELRAPVAGAMIFHGNTSPDGAPVDGRGVWSELRPGHGVGYASDGTTATYSNRFGIELTFARTLLEGDPEARIAIIKYSRGGSSIDRAAASYFGCWDPGYPGGRTTGVNQYDHFLATVRHAMSVDDIDGDGEADTLVPTGIVWMQGESDAFHSEEIALRYEGNLERLMDLIRAAFREPDLPVAIGRISDSGRDDTEQDGKVWNQGDVVRAAQASFVLNDACAALVTSTDGYSYSDPWHYDSAGYIDLGARFAEAILGLQSCATTGVPDPDPLRFQPEIDEFAVWDRKNRAPERPVLFVGSSSIRLWPTAQSFPECPIVNRGFGGAHVSDVAYFYDDIVMRYRPPAIVVYAGDNDIAAGKSPDQVLSDFAELLDRVHRDLPETTLIYLAIKPSPSRWRHWRDMEAVNRRIEELAGSEDGLLYVDTATPMFGDGGTPREELFVTDLLHLNQTGYELWSSILGPYLSPACSATGQQGTAGE